MEFMLPVRFSGVRNFRVTADTLDEAVKKVREDADTKLRFELALSGGSLDVLAPMLMLSTEELETWPYWEFWHTGVDGTDWHVGYTALGRKSVPKYAESCCPVPKDYLESWSDEK